MNKLLYLLISVSFLACSDECITCTNDDLAIEFCNDETNYTDFDGNLITYDEVITLYRSQGYTCE